MPHVGSSAWDQDHLLSEKFCHPVKNHPICSLPMNKDARRLKHLPPSFLPAIHPIVSGPYSKPTPCLQDPFLLKGDTYMWVKNELGWGIGIEPDSLVWVWKSFMVKTEPMQLSHESKKRLKDRDRTVGRKREVGSPNERNQAFKCTQVSKSLLWMASTLRPPAFRLVTHEGPPLS